MLLCSYVKYNKLPSRYHESSGTTFTYLCMCLRLGKKEKSACDLFTPTLTNSLKIALHIASSMVTAELHLDFHKIVYSTKVPTIDFARTKLRKIYAFPSAMP